MTVPTFLRTDSGIHINIVQPQPWQATQSRYGGRSGGPLKRKKKPHDPRVIQTGLGHRMEFFWRKRERRTRYPLVQNVRPNLIWDSQFKRWLVMWYKGGFQVFRPFNATRDRFERARAKAMILMRQLEKAGRLQKLPAPDICKSGVRGVFYDGEEKLWIAVWKQNGLRRFRCFPALEMGFDQAFKAAVAVRRQKLAEFHEFVPQRERIRTGREQYKAKAS
ncbi:unnamed protein product [Vitrella brassicaformis CCMP3155]|uniref:Uncharacterized protein n=1 Tax=Vitrella brassicaformis (strain CCMP3155) TaxID=1169540 RepID=A0A0G4FT58_VITBC|nr:unnamed protein product [Vitrella brassicaformis CCMP3155]|eukprot:CEM17867.1 unnamed protein product [Vitrella brassicaformis CCMP3155]